MTSSLLHKAGGLLIKDKKFMLERHGGNDTFIVPGGKLESGETAMQALIREFNEEFHIEIAEENVQPIGVFEAHAVHNPDKIVRIETFIIKNWKGHIVLDDGIEEVVWVDSQTITDINASSIAKEQVLPVLLHMQLVK